MSYQRRAFTRTRPSGNLPVNRFDIWPRIRSEVMAEINQKPGIFRSHGDVLCVLVIGIATLAWALYLLGMFQDFQNWKWMLGY